MSIKHLLSIDQLSANDISNIFKLAANYVDNKKSHLLTGQTVINLFFENSSRTLISFTMAAQFLGANVISVPVTLSSITKGETLADTIMTINAMRPNFIIIRHQESGILEKIAKISEVSIINAGDGSNEHPSQALLDAYTIMRHKKNFKNLKIAICGDILHSRVARSNIKLFKKLGSEIRLIGPATLLPHKNTNLATYTNIEDGIKDVDVIITLRLQHERMQGNFIPSAAEFAKFYGLNHERLKHAKPDVMVLHPGPINRNIEISSMLADDKKYSFILEQVSVGIAIRQAIFSILI